MNKFADKTAKFAVMTKLNANFRLKFESERKTLSKKGRTHRAEKRAKGTVGMDIEKERENDVRTKLRRGESINPGKISYPSLAAVIKEYYSNFNAMRKSCEKLS